MDHPAHSLWLSLSWCWILQVPPGQPGFPPTCPLACPPMYLTYPNTRISKVQGSWLVPLPSWTMPSQLDLLCSSGTWSHTTMGWISPRIFPAHIYVSFPRKLPNGAQRLRGCIRIVRAHTSLNATQWVSIVRGNSGLYLIDQRRLKPLDIVSLSCSRGGLVFLSVCHWTRIFLTKQSILLQECWLRSMGGNEGPCESRKSEGMKCILHFHTLLFGTR